MGKRKRRKKNRCRRLTPSDKILIAAIVNALVALIEIILDE